MDLIISVPVKAAQPAPLPDWFLTEDEEEPVTGLGDSTFIPFLVEESCTIVNVIEL